MHDVVVRIDEGRNGLGVKRRIQDVAVVAPVSAEDQEDALVVLRSCGQRGCDRRRSFSWVGIELCVGLRRFGKAHRRLGDQITSLR